LKKREESIEKFVLILMVILFNSAQSVYLNQFFCLLRI